MADHYKIIYDGDSKRFISKEYNYIFNMKTGFMAQWGATFKDDPEMCFAGPTIFDCEVTTICNGIGDRGACSFCLPAGANIELENGMKKIEHISVGDIVKSYNEVTKSIVTNKVLEKYERPYTGIMVNVELEDGTITSLTENHPVYVKNHGWLRADQLLSGMDVIKIS